MGTKQIIVFCCNQDLVLGTVVDHLLRLTVVIYLKIFRMEKFYNETWIFITYWVRISKPHCIHSVISDFSFTKRMDQDCYITAVKHHKTQHVWQVLLRDPDLKTSTRMRSNGSSVEIGHLGIIQSWHNSTGDSITHNCHVPHGDFINDGIAES